MKAKRQVQRQLKQDYRRYKRRIAGILGDYSGTVDVPNRVGYVFVRLRNQEVKEAFNKRVPSLVDLPVWVGYSDDPGEPQILQVLDTRTGVERQKGEDPIGLYLPAHHETHEWFNPLGGQDVVFSDKRQFMPFRPTPIGGMLLHVYRNVGWLNGEYTYFSGSSIDLSPYVPATGAYMGLVYEDTNATLAFSSGTGDFLKDGFTLTPANTPKPIPGTYPIAAVRMWGGMTGIVEALDRTDLIDLRFPFTQNFLLLSDVPWSYTGSAGQLVSVKSDETGLEFVSSSGITGSSPSTFLGLTDTPSSYSGQATRHVRVNSGATALEFVTGTMMQGDAARGDLTGTYPNPTVKAIQGNSVQSGTPSDNQILIWDSTNNRWEFGNQSGGGTDLFIYDNSIFKVTGTAISFDGGLDVSVTGSIAFIKSSDDFPIQYSEPITENAWGGILDSTSTPDFPVMVNQQHPSITSIDRSGTVWQTTAFWNENRYMVIAVRKADANWTLYTYDGTGGLPTIQFAGTDNHNYAHAGLDSVGIIHVVYDHHNSALKYRKSTLAIESFAGVLGSEISMLGTNESDVTYPKFYNDPSGELYVIFRDGIAHNGDIYFYKYNTGTSSWAAASGTGTGGKLIDGKTASPTRGPYVDHPSFDEDFSVTGTYMHISWTWRISGASPVRERELSYVKWDGVSFYKSSGASQTVPITPTNCDVVDPATESDHLVGFGTNYSDNEGNPHISYIKDGTDGFRHVFHAYYNGSVWTITQVNETQNEIPSNDDYSDQYQPTILIDRNTNVAYIYHIDAFDRPGLIVHTSSPNNFSAWNHEVIYPRLLSDIRSRYIRFGLDYEAWERSKVVYFIIPFWKDYVDPLPIDVFRWTPIIGGALSASDLATRFEILQDSNGDFLLDSNGEAIYVEVTQ